MQHSCRQKPTNSASLSQSCSGAFAYRDGGRRSMCWPSLGALLVGSCGLEECGRTRRAASASPSRVSASGLNFDPGRERRSCCLALFVRASSERFLACSLARRVFPWPFVGREYPNDRLSVVLPRISASPELSSCPNLPPTPAVWRGDWDIKGRRKSGAKESKRRRNKGGMKHANDRA